MAYNPTYPTLFDEALQLSITKLKEWGYLQPDTMRMGVISWGNTASIMIEVNTNNKHPYIELKYKYQNKAVQYQIELYRKQGNLGGYYYYFICPITGKLCRKLYLINGYFVHRTTSAGMYECQTRSRKERNFHKIFSVILNTDELINEINKKHFTKFYRGKPTKKYKRILKQLEKANNINIDELKNTFH